MARQRKTLHNFLVGILVDRFISKGLDFFELFRNIMSIRLFIHIILISTILKITFQNIKDK